MPGKALRMQRIIHPETKHTLIIPIDHGAGEGPMPGLENMGSIIQDVSEGGANALIGHMGMGIQAAQFKKPETAFIYHLSVSTRVNPSDKNDKVLVNDVERALSMGADGVSVHINVGSQNESSQLKDLGMVAGECQKYGLPLLAMMYPRGEGLTDDPKSEDMVGLAVRIGAELGADIVKTYYTGDKESFARVCSSVPVPVVIAGGGKSSDEEAFTIVRDVIDAGGAGVTFGRKVFQHEKRVQFIKALRALIHEGISVESALEMMS